MISLRQRVLWASLLASATFASSGAFAQAPLGVTAAPSAEARAVTAAPAPASAEHKRWEHRDPAQRMARMQAHRAKKMAELKTKLNLSAAQETAWTSYTAATQPPAGMRPQRMDRAELAKLTTPQRLDRMQAKQTERSARFAQRADATRTFYAGLSAEQQKTFDAQTMHGGRHGHGHRGHHGRGHHDGKQMPAPAKG